MQSAVDDLTVALIQKYYEKGYWQGKHDEQDGIYIGKRQLAEAIKEDLTREMDKTVAT